MVTQLDGAALLASPELAALDPELDSLVNLNTPDDYARARARPGPEVTVLRHGAAGAGGSWHVRAATVAQAAAAIGLDPSRPLAATVLAMVPGDPAPGDGDPALRTDDGELPLVTGDTVCFPAAAGP